MVKIPVCFGCGKNFEPRTEYDVWCPVCAGFDKNVSDNNKKMWKKETRVLTLYCKGYINNNGPAGLLLTIEETNKHSLVVKKEKNELLRFTKHEMELNTIGELWDRIRSFIDTNYLD